MNLLALLLQTDADQQAAVAKAVTGLGFGLIAFGFLLIVAIFAFIIFLFWRILVKAGFSGALSLLALPFIPFGALIVLCILAFGNWKVIPAPVAYVPGLPPNYPPQAPLPPGNYPPQQY